jgi:hypothetical protein
VAYVANPGRGLRCHGTVVYGANPVPSLSLYLSLLREAEAQGSGSDRRDFMRQFRAAWDRSSADPAASPNFSR